MGEGQIIMYILTGDKDKGPQASEYFWRRGEWADTHQASTSHCHRRFFCKAHNFLRADGFKLLHTPLVVFLIVLADEDCHQHPHLCVVKLALSCVWRRFDLGYIWGGGLTP